MEERRRLGTTEWRKRTDDSYWISCVARCREYGRRRSKRLGIGHAREVASPILVDPLDASLCVGDGQLVFDARQRPVKDPELAVGNASVQDLDHDFDILGAEEPEQAGIAGDGLRFAGT